MSSSVPPSQPRAHGLALPREGGAAPSAQVPVHALRALVAWIFDAVADALARRLREAQVDERDPAWGMVSQRTLPEWLPVETYVEACRAGKIEGAVKWRRQWIARRDAIMAWVLAEARSGGDDGSDDLDPESTEAILKANNITLKK